MKNNNVQAVDSGIKRFRYFDILMSVFIVVLILSNITSSAKIVDISIGFLGIHLVFDGGTLVFPLSYILGDILTEVYGFRASRKVIWTGFALLAFSSLLFFILSKLTGEAVWEKEAGSAAYNVILGGMSSGGIVLASLIAFFTGEFSNSMILSRIKVLMSGKILFIRTIVSTLVGELLDTFIFSAVATLAGVFPKEIFLKIAFTNYVLKCAFEIVWTPLTCLIARKLKEWENTDVYDRGISYNPFTFF
jgi:uncharacterized integral membrane protein (TIGR00697 family)